MEQRSLNLKSNSINMHIDSADREHGKLKLLAVFGIPALGLISHYNSCMMMTAEMLSRNRRRVICSSSVGSV